MIRVDYFFLNITNSIFLKNMKWFTQALDLNPNSGLEQFIHFLAKTNL
jgi:hypothetical protein